MIYEKPKNEIFASDAKDGEIVEFPNVKRGWGVTENLGFIPPMEYFNAAFNRVDKSLAYQLQRGVGEWDKDMEYPIGAVVSLNGVIYIAKSQNTNKNPANEATIWGIFATQKWCEDTFMNKTDKIDAYTKSESDDKFVLKTELTDGLPIGAYLSYPSQKTVPAGFLIADGRSLKKAEYTELFDVLGYVYGGSGENFNIPKFDDGRFFRSVGGNAAPLGQLQLGSKIVQAGHYIGNTAEDFDETVEKDVTVNTCASPAGPILSNKVRIRPTNSSVVIIIKAKNVNTPTAGQIDKTILATETKAGIAKLKNAITAKQEDAAVTEKAVSNIVFGIGQTYTNVKDVKRINENYENTTEKPIFVIVSVYAQTQSYIIANVNDVVVGGIGTGAGGQYTNTVMSFMVPPGARYKLTNTYNAAIESWFELR
jgi:hypothetical protein